MIERKWRVRLGAVAELDFVNILKWTSGNFGAQQSRTYRDTLVRAISELASGPDVAGSKARDEIMPGLRTLHVARQGRRGRHVLLYQVVEGRIIENRPHPSRPDGLAASLAICNGRKQRLSPSWRNVMALRGGHQADM